VLLVVDDEDLPRSVTARMLVAAGYRVLTASSAAEALKLLEDPAVAVRLVITDLKMPGMGGRELAERLHQRSPAPQVLFISGYPSPRTTTGLPGPFLAKPFSEQDLLLRVRGLLKEN
jgi:two-component system, cell cycle sensor histidine kinase and response regulator CckA